MNILYILSNRLPTEKAQGYQSIKMIEAFSKNNKVTAFYPNRKNSEELNKVKNIFKYYFVNESFVLKQIMCFDFVCLTKIKLYRVWFLIHSISYALFSALYFMFYGKKIDIIYSRSKFVMFIFSLLFKKKKVFELHSLPRWGNSFMLRVAKRADKLVVITEKLKELCIKAGIKEEKILVEPDAVDLKKFNIELSKNEARKKLNIPQKKIIVAFVGNFHTMEMEKGIPEIINSSKYLLSEYKNLFFYFVGGPINRETKYRKIIGANTLSQDRFLFFKKQPVKTVPLWLKASDILLMPHPKNTFYSYYVSPLKMFEYMASQRPIVASKLPAIEEILTDKTNALLGIPGDSQSIADNIKILLDNEELGKNLAKNAFESVKRFTWDKRAKRIIDFITDKNVDRK